jgi:hypothetical protein
MQMTMTSANKKKRLGPEVPLKPYIKPLGYHRWDIEGDVSKEVVIIVGQLNLFVTGYLNIPASDSNHAADLFLELVKGYELPKGFALAAGNFENEPSAIIRIGTIKIPPSEQVHVYIMSV